MKPLYSDWAATLPKDCLQTGERIDKETMLHFRENSTAWIYAGQCYAGKHINKNPALMPMIYVCSRYRAETREQLHMNIEVAKHTCQMIANGGGIPIAPHLYFPRFMNDDMPQERYFGMEAGKRLMEQCVSFHVVTVDGVISEGMREEIKYMTETLLLEGSATNYTRQEAEQIVMNRMER